MTTNTDADIAKKHAELRATRDAFAAKLTEALVAAGFKVSNKLPTADWMGGTLTISSDKLAGFDNYVTFEIVGTRWSRGLPSYLKMKFMASNGYRTKGIYYKKLDDELVTKLVATVSANLEAKISQQKASVEAAKTQAEWQTRKNAELKGLSVPPGAKVLIRMGNGRGAGTFSFQFDNQDRTLADVEMTKEQVFKLSAVLNEIMDVQNRFVLVGEQNGRKVVFSRGYAWLDESHTYAGPMLMSRDEAEVQCARYAAMQNVTSVKILSHAEFATI